MEALCIPHLMEMNACLVASRFVLEYCRQLLLHNAQALVLYKVLARKKQGVRLLMDLVSHNWMERVWDVEFLAVLLPVSVECTVRVLEFYKWF